MNVVLLQKTVKFQLTHSETWTIATGSELVQVNDTEVVNQRLSVIEPTVELKFKM